MPMNELSRALWTSAPAVLADEATAFDLAPVSLWLEDYGALKLLFETWRAEGVTDLRAHLLADLSRIDACKRLIRVLKVNRRTLELYEASDEIHLFARIEEVFREIGRAHV